MTTPFLFVPVFSWPAAPGGKLHTYAAGGTVAQGTWTDAAGTNPQSNPVTLDANGTAVVRLTSGLAYHMVLKDSTDTTTLWDADNYQAVYLADIGAALYPRTTAETAASVTPTNYAYPAGHWFRYGADPLGVADATTAINNALKVSAGALSYGPKGTYKVTATLRMQDNSELYCEPLCQINYTDTSAGTFAFQIGAAGVGGGDSIARNLSIILQTKTAGGIKLLNSKLSRLVNPYVQGYTAVIDGTRTNIGLQITGDTGLITFWNRIEDAYINNCHTAVQFPNTGANQITKNYFVNFNAWGGSTQGDTSSVCFDVQSYNGAFSNMDQGYLDGFGGYYFKFQGATGWRIRAVVIDGESLTTANPVAVSFDAATGDCKLVECFISSICKVLDASPLNSGNEYRGLMSSAKIGSSFAGAPQNYAGLNDHTGQIAAQALTLGGSQFVAIAGGTIQTLQGACYVPSTGLLYAASKQGNLLWFDPTSEVRGSLNYTSTLSNTDRIPICYCPSNGFIYIANRADNTLVVVNPKTATVVQSLNLVPTAGAGCSPYGIAYCPFNNKIYVAQNGTNNLSIITPTSNGTDSVAQTLAGFSIALLTVAYCPITQKMYVGGQNANLFIITTTTNATDSIAQTLGITGSNFFGIAYCHRNQKMYVAAGNVASLNVVNPTTGGTDTVIQTIALTVGGNTLTATRAIVYDVAADALVLLGSNSRCAVIYPSQAGTADLCTNVQVTAGSGVDLVYHPNAGKVYECNASNLYEYA